jgi:hypothetical protein
MEKQRHARSTCTNLVHDTCGVVAQHQYGGSAVRQHRLHLCQSVWRHQHQHHQHQREMRGCETSREHVDCRVSLHCGSCQWSPQCKCHPHVPSACQLTRLQSPQSGLHRHKKLMYGRVYVAHTCRLCAIVVRSCWQLHQMDPGCAAPSDECAAVLVLTWLHAAVDRVSSKSNEKPRALDNSCCGPARPRVFTAVKSNFFRQRGLITASQTSLTDLPAKRDCQLSALGKHIGPLHLQAAGTVGHQGGCYKARPVLRRSLTHVHRDTDSHR